VNQYALRALIRTHIEAGALPRNPGHQLFGGKGDGARCACCNHPIEREQVLYEVMFAPAGGTPASFAMHMACYSAWLNECAQPMAAVS
jgi:hypothetical protein